MEIFTPRKPPSTSRFAFDFVDQRPVGRHRDFDPKRRGLLDHVRYLRPEHRFTPGDVDLLRAEFCQFIQDFFETLGGNGRLTCLTPVVAHLAFEIAPVKDFQLDIQRLEWTRVQDRLS